MMKKNNCLQKRNLNLTKLVQGGKDSMNKLINRAGNFNQRLIGCQRRRGANTNEIDIKIKTFRKYNNYLNIC